jgi:hypothetical protein
LGDAQPANSLRRRGVALAILQPLTRRSSAPLRPTCQHRSDRRSQNLLCCISSLDARWMTYFLFRPSRGRSLAEWGASRAEGPGGEEHHERPCERPRY